MKQQLEYYIQILNTSISMNPSFKLEVKIFLHGILLEQQNESLLHITENKTGNATNKDLLLVDVSYDIALVFLSLDYFNQNYPSGEPYQNQSLGVFKTQSEVAQTLAPSLMPPQSLAPTFIPNQTQPKVQPQDSKFIAPGVIGVVFLADFFFFQVGRPREITIPAYPVTVPSQSSGVHEHDSVDQAFVLSIVRPLSVCEHEKEGSNGVALPILEESSERFLGSWIEQSIQH